MLNFKNRPVPVSVWTMNSKFILCLLIFLRLLR